MLNNTIDFGLALMQSLQLVYTRILAAYESTAQAGDSLQFGKLLSLARMFGNLLNGDRFKCRSAVLILHRTGICYAMGAYDDDDDGDDDEEDSNPPENLLFLKVLRQLVHPLLRYDILEMLKYLDNTAKPSTCPEWEPFHSYRKALVDAYTQYHA